MEPGFLSIGWRELGALLLAITIVVDWAVLRYGAPRGVRDPRAQNAATSGGR